MADTSCAISRLHRQDLDNKEMRSRSIVATSRRTERLEAFSDALLAVAFTLPATELRVPEVGPNGDLSSALANLWPSYLSYGLGCVVIGIYWARSHFLGKILEKTDHVYNLLNLLFLASVSILPFPTRALVDHIHGDRNSTTASVIYTAALLVPALVWTVKWSYAARVRLLDARITDRYLRRGEKVYAATSIGLAVSVLLAKTNWRLGVALAWAITLFYMAPPKEPDYKPGREPADDIEEPDDRLREQRNVPGDDQESNSRPPK